MPIDLEAAAAERGIRYFLVAFTDLLGTQRAKLVPAASISACCAEGVTFAGFATGFDMSPADADLTAIPDPDGLIQLPWKPEVGWVPADLYLNAAPFGQDPRHLLKRVKSDMSAHGLRVGSSVRPEFFLITSCGSEPAISHPEQSTALGNRTAAIQCENIIGEIRDAMSALHWNPHRCECKDPHGLFGIDWEAADALVTADRHAFFKYMTRSVAEQHGLRATFMPKPFSTLPGSSCHTRFLLRPGQENVLSTDATKSVASGIRDRFISGILTADGALTALTNPTVNSYKRLNELSESKAIGRERGDKFHDLRFVRVSRDGSIELLTPDNSANTYLLQAGPLIAGLNGLQRQGGQGWNLAFHPCIKDAASGYFGKIPQNLLDALRSLEASYLFNDYSECLIRAFLNIKFLEWMSYSQNMSLWELKNLREY